jgi:hypothetical protein
MEHVTKAVDTITAIAIITELAKLNIIDYKVGSHAITMPEDKWAQVEHLLPPPINEQQ